jgi:hypothetical protein
MDNTFFPRIEEHIAATAAKSAMAYERKMLSSLLDACVGAERRTELEQEAANEFGFLWFNSAFTCPVALMARKVVVTPVELLRSPRFLKSKLWTAYWELRRTLPDRSSFGLIFPIANLDQFIMHNNTTLHIPFGCNAIVRYSTDPDKELRIVPWSAFTSALQKVWVPA